MNLKKLVKLANHYDLKGEYAKADALDLFLKKASEDEVTEEDRIALNEAMFPNQLSIDEAQALYDVLKGKIKSLGSYEISFEEKISGIKKMEDDLKKYFDSGHHLGTYLVERIMSVLGKSENHFDIVKEEIFPMLSKMIFNALLAFKFSGYAFGRSFGREFLKLISDSRKERSGTLSKMFAEYIMSQPEIQKVLKSMRPNQKETAGYSYSDDPLRGEEFLNRYKEESERNYRFPRAEGPAKVYKEIQELEDSRYDD
jgi:hypothetical protein